MSTVYDRVLITGGGGMLAKALVAALRNRGVEALAMDRAALDIERKASEVLADLTKIKPSLVLNCAAFTKVDDCEEHLDRALRANGFAPGYLAAGASVLGAKFVQFSTDFVFDGSANRPYRTD